MTITPSSGINTDKESTIVTLKTLDRDTLYVGGTGTGNYSTIQEAIDDASDGDTVFVYNESSPYVENVVVNKSIDLIGEDKDSTVIDSNMIGVVVNVTVDWVNISGFTIKNCSSVTSSTFAGIGMRSSYSTITDNNIVSNKRHGIYLEDSNYNTISGNNISKNRYTVTFVDSEYNIISYNDIECGWNGVKLRENSHFNNISYNQIVGTSSTSALIDIERDCNNTQVHYNMLSKGKTGITTYINWGTNISGNIINNCDSNGISLRGGWGEFGGRHIAHENWVTNCGSIGIYCGQSIFNNISHNYISSTSRDGIYLYKSNGNTIFNNTINSNPRTGLYLLESSPDNMIFNNTINSNEVHGIYIEKTSPNQTIFGNTINSNKGHGIYINGSSSYNTIFENNISENNGFGIRIENYSSPSKFNIIYHNNLLNNTFNGYDNCDNNSWNNGYPSGGNYWSDYNGTDDYRGPNQNILGSDSIGDTPKNIYGYTSDDYYPLMYPWGEQRPVANYTYLILGDGGILFNGSSSYDYEGVVIHYEWDFDDGTNGQGVVVTHGYNESGTYDVTLTVTDDDGYQGSYTRSIEAEKNHPPTAPLIDGPIEAKAGKSHNYNFTSEDPELADVSYYIEWGDGKITPWCDFLSSGETYRTNHGWAKGTYTIRCKAKDIYGVESNWSTLEVTMPKSKSFNFNFNLLSWLFERFPNAFPLLRQLLGL